MTFNIDGMAIENNCITVTIVDDSVPEHSETFTVALSISTMLPLPFGLQLGANTETTITIEDDDCKLLTLTTLLQCV